MKNLSPCPVSTMIEALQGIPFRAFLVSQADSRWITSNRNISNYFNMSLFIVAVTLCSLCEKINNRKTKESKMYRLHQHNKKNKFFFLPQIHRHGICAQAHISKRRIHVIHAAQQRLRHRPQDQVAVYGLRVKTTRLYARNTIDPATPKEISVV